MASVADRKEEREEKGRPDTVIAEGAAEKLERLIQEETRAKTVSWTRFVRNMGSSPEPVGTRKGTGASTRKIAPVHVIDLDDSDEGDNGSANGDGSTKRSSSPKVKKEDNTSEKALPVKRKAFCYNCGRAGHSGDECRLPSFDEICTCLPLPNMARQSEWWRKYAMDAVLFGPRIPLTDERGIKFFTVSSAGPTPSPGLKRRRSPNMTTELQVGGGGGGNGNNKPVLFCEPNESGGAGNSSNNNNSSSSSSSNSGGSGGAESTKNGGSATSKVDDIDDEGIVIGFIDSKRFKGV